MSEWKQQANERREFRQAKVAPEVPKRQGKRRKQAKNFAVHTRILWHWYENTFERESDARAYLDKMIRAGRDCRFEDLREPTP